jgi:hypothetical protein
MAHVRHGRRAPYTDRGIKKLPCVRCAKPALFQWNACADGNLWRPICGKCDVALNRMVLRWMGDPLADKKASDYAVARGIA